MKCCYIAQNHLSSRFFSHSLAMKLSNFPLNSPTIFISIWLQYQWSIALFSLCFPPHQLVNILASNKADSLTVILHNQTKVSDIF